MNDLDELVQLILICLGLVAIALAGAVFVAIWRERPLPQRDDDGVWRAPRPGRRR